MREEAQEGGREKYCAVKPLRVSAPGKAARVSEVKWAAIGGFSTHLTESPRTLGALYSGMLVLEATAPCTSAETFGLTHSFLF